MSDRKPLVLVIEDDAAAAESLLLILRDWGAEVVHGADGDAVVSALGTRLGEVRWIITDFAFLTDASGNVLAPAYQCIAASMSGDPIAGGWTYYSRLISDNLNDYPKFGIWPDGLYMSANMFAFGAGSTGPKQYCAYSANIS